MGYGYCTLKATIRDGFEASIKRNHLIKLKSSQENSMSDSAEVARGCVCVCARKQCNQICRHLILICFPRILCTAQSVFFTKEKKWKFRGDKPKDRQKKVIE